MERDPNDAAPDRSPRPDLRSDGDLLVSVIIPCFNVEDYLDECVASVVAQSYESLEVVLINDGSSDSTGKLVDRWGDRDVRIRTVHQDNQGLGGARNTGIAMSSGEFFFFLDSDDLLPFDAIGRMVDSVRFSGSDIVSGVAERFDSSGARRADQYRGLFDVDHQSTHIFRDPLLVYDQMACSKLFRRSFWETEGLVFPTGSLYEDVEVVMKAHCRASSVDLIADTTYCWRRRETGDLSITQDRYRPGSTSARFEALGRADALLRTHAPDSVWTEHGVKVLSVDIRLYSRLLEGAGPEFIDDFMTSAGNLASSISPDAVLRVNPVVRQLRNYLISGNVDGVIACTRLFSGSNRRSLRRFASGTAWFARHDARFLASIATQTTATALHKLRTRS